MWGGVVEAVFNRRCRGRRKESSTVPDTAIKSLSTLTALPTHSSLKTSAWSINSERSESHSQDKFRSAQELKEAKKKAQEREHRWDANAGSWNTPVTHRSGVASPRSSRHTPRSQSLPPRSGIKHSDNEQSFTNKSPATLRLSDLTRKPKPMSQYVMANPFSSHRREAPAPPAPAPSARSASSSRASGKQPMTAEELAQLRVEQLQQLRAARLEPASSGEQPMTAEQLLQLRRAAAVHKTSAYSADTELARIPTFRRHRSVGRPRQERTTYDTLPQINPPPRTYETLSKHAAPTRVLPPPSDSSDGLLYSLNEMKRAVGTAACRSESPLPPAAFSA